MQFIIQREALLKPLQRIHGALDKRQTLPILGNILVVVKNQRLSLTATDLEIEMIARVALTEPAQNGEITIPGKKLIDICKALPEKAAITFTLTDNKIIVKSQRSRYVMACLPAKDFPNVEESPGDVELSVPQAILRKLLDFTCFAMATQDVRYYLNGLLIVFEKNEMRVVAADGHRLATMSHAFSAKFLESPLKVIVPRKAVLEMQRLFAEGEEEIGLVLGKNHLRAISTQVSFVTKLIEGKFPDYSRVMPTKGQCLIVAREPFRQAVMRASVLFSDKYRGVGLQFHPNLLKIIAVTTDKDEVEEELEIAYEGPVLEIGVNASYLLEYLNVVEAEAMIKITFSSPNQVILFEAQSQQGGTCDNTSHHAYAVMPMRL